MRLKFSAYDQPIKYIQSLPQEYARARLSKASDKVIAIAGLSQRIERVLPSNGRFGVFEVFLPRLLLWRVSDRGDGVGGGTSNREHRIPSWSWMMHDRIEFFPEEHIRVLKRGTITFGSLTSDSAQELHAPVRRLLQCKIVQQSGCYGISDSNNNNLGELWFDGSICTQIDNRVVVALRQKDDIYSCQIHLIINTGELGLGWRRLGAYLNSLRRESLSKLWRRRMSIEIRLSPITSHSF